ncbi:hypothetical protein TRVA0_065S00342 [Trichomonascus vanleenenianus]|uniref:glycoside hydrolase family 31 protein n=1 Tax=Trichomonascus vanleenenianus TaxID=2268995 RepID=UPI003EC979C3
MKVKTAWVMALALLPLSVLAYQQLDKANKEQQRLKILGSQLTPTVRDKNAPDPQKEAPGYQCVNITYEEGVGFTAILELDGKPTDVFGIDIPKLNLSVEYQSKNRVRVSIEPAQIENDQEESYYILPADAVPRGYVEDDSGDENSDWRVQWSNDPSFWFQIIRKSTGDTVFSTEGYKIVFENQFLEFATELPLGHNIFGLGETIDDFRIKPGTVRTMHNADIPDRVGANLYGTHPVYMEERRDNGDYAVHGVYLRNAHSQEIIVGEEELKWRVLGGSIELYFFSGPSPNEVIRQYQRVIGLPAMHQYWTLGYHHSRYGMKSADDFWDRVEKHREHGIPLETMWSDIDHMDRFRDFTLHPENYPEDKFRGIIEELHKRNQYYVPIIDAAIYSPDDPENSDYETYNSGRKLDVFVKNSAENTYFVGRVWPGPCVFPDWLGFNTFNWWYSQLDEFHKKLPYDGIWLDMNEVSSFCTRDDCQPRNRGNYKQFTPYGRYFDGTEATEPVRLARNVIFPKYVINNGVAPNEMSGRTMPMDAIHAGRVLEYDWHNLWGFQETKNTYEALAAGVLPNMRPFLISRSTFAGSGKYTGHWGGDNFSKWEYLRYSISQGLSFSLFGMPMFGTDACGFIGNSNEEMCNRWSQLNAFFSFYRNHNDLHNNDQEYYLWDSVTEAAKKALDIRYRLLPYMYTMLHKSHDNGDPWLRALSWEFKDPSLIGIDTEFLVGGSILVVPVLERGRVAVENAVLPSEAVWYDWYTSELVHGGSNLTIDAPLGHIPVYVRGGSIIALQEPGYTTKECRENPWELLVALDSNGDAHGELYLDDGVSLAPRSQLFTEFHASLGGLSLVTKGKYSTPQLSKIRVLGILSAPKSVSLNGEHAKFEFSDETKVLNITCDIDNWLYGLELKWE